MSYRERLINLASIYCERTGRSLSTVGNMAVNDGNFFSRLQSGGGCTMDTYEKLIKWFEEHTPAA